MPNTPARSDSRAAILAAAHELFGVWGYARTSLTEIAEKANVTKGAVYHHFGSKQGLFEQVYRAVEADVQLRARNQALLAHTRGDKIKAAVAEYLDSAVDPLVQQITFIDAPAVLGTDFAGPIDASAFAELCNYIQAGIEAGEIQAVDPGAVTAVIRGACLQGAIYIARAPDKVEARAYTGVAISLLIDALIVSVPATGER